MTLGGGYQEPSGSFYSETEPMRFLRLINFANSNIKSTGDLLAKSGIAQFNTDGILSLSAYRFKYYHYDEWNSMMASLSGQNVASGMLDWMRSLEPFYWYYYDQGNSGNFTRRLMKNVGFPYDDISTIPVGDEPLNRSFPLINSSGGRIKEESSIYLPFYQSAGLIEQIQSTYQTMFENQITNSVHPANSAISGVPVPQIGKSVALQLNNLNLQPTGFISEYAVPRMDSSGNIIFPLNISPGSGYQPILDMAQQINYPREYITNISAIVPFYLAGTAQPTTDCSHPPFGAIGGFLGQSVVNTTKGDVIRSQIYFGFMLPSSNINISLSGSLPLYSFTGNEHTRMGNSRGGLGAHAYPTIVTELHSVTSADSAYPGTYSDNIIFSLSSSLTSGNYSFNFSTSGTTHYTIQITGAAIQGSNSALLGYNTFSRYYDPLGDANSDNHEFGNDNTTNFYLKVLTGWNIRFDDPKPCWGTSNAYFNVPYLSLSNGFNTNINGVDIPTTKYDAAKIGNITNPSIVNSDSGPCYPVISGTVTITYKMPAIYCSGYHYGIGQAITNPGASNGTSNCVQFGPGGNQISICHAEDAFRASKFGGCCPNPLGGICQNANTLGITSCDTSPPSYTTCSLGFIPNGVPFRIKNSCGDTVFSTALPGAFPDVINMWEDVTITTTVNIGGANLYLNNLQGLFCEMDLQSEWECITLALSQSNIGVYNGCFKDAPGGQLINTGCSPSTLAGGQPGNNSCTAEGQGIPCGASLDSSDLLVNLMVTQGGQCQAAAAVNGDGNSLHRNNCNNNTSPTCGNISNSILSLEGKSVTVLGVVGNLTVQCPDGSTAQSSFSLGGGGGTYPAPLNGYTCASIAQTTTVQFGGGTASAACNSWW